MTDYAKQILAGQFEAALAMLSDCIQKCPPEHWDGIIGKYPFWQVAYHTLCFTDLYLSPNEGVFQPGKFQPQGWRELDDEYPSRRFDQREIAEYLALCLQKLRTALAAETPASLQGESGFARRKFSRGELYIYTTRHIQHHAAQLSAYLRRLGPAFQDLQTLPWRATGWPGA